jgi:hypothetical protein
VDASISSAETQRSNKELGLETQGSTVKLKKRRSAVKFGKEFVTSKPTPKIRERYNIYSIFLNLFTRI